MTASFQSSLTNSQDVYITREHDYTRINGIKDNCTLANPRGINLPDTASTNIDTNSTYNGKTQEDISPIEENGGTWINIPNKRGLSSTNAPSFKKAKQTCITLQNSFDALNECDEMDSNEQEPSPIQTKESKPPPIFVPNITNVKAMVTSIESVISKDDYTYKCSNQNSIKLCPVTIDAYRKLVKKLTELNVNFHTFQMKQEKAYRVVLKNMHFSTDTSEIKEAIESYGFKVRNIANARNFKTKLPMSMFFVDLEPSAQNKEVYNIQFLLNAKIVFEPPYKRNEVVQCKRCQSYGHTKSYCRHPHRCVKCGSNHDSLDCKKPKEEPPKCALCGGNHPANYKGCTAYKEVKQKSFPPLRQRNTTPLHDSNEASNNSRPRDQPSTSTDITSHRDYDKVKTYAQVAAPENKCPNQGDISGITQVINNFFGKFEKIMLQQAQQIGTLMNLLSTVISKLK